VNHLTSARLPSPHRLRAPRILVVDDEPEALLYIMSNLQATGYEVVTAEDGAEALERVKQHAPDAIVLDLMMPGLDGFNVCRAIRAVSPVPILILSARDREFDKVRALDLGADDYLTKPFGVEEFLARIRAVLRRHHVLTGVPERHLRVGALSIDLEARQVTVAGQPVRLTPTEYALVVELARHAGAVLTHRQLLQRVWGVEYGNEGSYLHTYIRRLRRKIEADPGRPTLLLTQPGIGYRLASGLLG
jgi:two-component system KDP operon response regulator KdpE